MKLNFKTISFGILAATLLTTPLALMKAANAVGGDGRGAKFEQLDLTEAQTSQIEAIRTETRSQVETVLTPEQRTTLENTESERGGLRGLDLTDEQRSQIRTLEEGSREQMNAILTDEQRQTLETLHSEGRGGRGRGLEDLNLTDEQSAQIEAIRAEARSQQAALLTAEQQAILGDGELGRGAGKSLDLTDEQREQMRAIHEASHEQIAAILTDEQRQQLPERRGNRGGSQAAQ